jgi:hypothetical protein
MRNLDVITVCPCEILCSYSGRANDVVPLGCIGSEKHTVSIFSRENGETFFRNVGISCESTRRNRSGKQHNCSFACNIFKILNKFRGN